MEIKEKHKKFSLLINFVKNELIDEIKKLLNKWPYLVKLRDKSGRSVIHYCSEHSSALCADFLLTQCPELLKIQDNDGYTALHLCIIGGNELLTRFLISKSDVNYLNSCDNEMHTAIHWATVCAELECLQLLIDAGAIVSTPDIHGAYPLHYAAQMCSPHSGICIANNSKIGLSVLNKLLKYVKDVDCSDNDCRTPLLWASSAEIRVCKLNYSSGSSDSILALVNAGANVFAQDKDGLTALHCASSRGHIDCVETLLSLCGAEVDQLDSNGCSPLFYSVTLGHADCTQMLIHSNADVNRQDCKGRTPSHCGAAKGQFETIKILSQNKANLWIRNIRGDLPLHEAVKSGRIELVKWLLEHMPSSVNATNSFGRSCLHIAAINNNIEMCKIMLDFDADVNAVMRFKNHLITPLDAALQRGYRGVAKYLLMHGSLPSSRIGPRISPNRCFSMDQQLNSSSNAYDLGAQSAIESSDEGKARQQSSNSLKKRSQSMRTNLPKLPSLVPKNETVLESSSSTSSFIDSGNHVRNVREFESQLERQGNLKQAIITNVYVTNNTPNNNHPKRVHPLKKVRKKRMSIQNIDDIRISKTHSPSLSSSSSLINFEDNNDNSSLKINEALKMREFDRQILNTEKVNDNITDTFTPELDSFNYDNKNAKSKLTINENTELIVTSHVNKQIEETENIEIEDKNHSEINITELNLNGECDSNGEIVLTDNIENINQITLDNSKADNIDNILGDNNSQINEFVQTDKLNRISANSEQKFIEKHDFDNKLLEGDIICENFDAKHNKLNNALLKLNNDDLGYNYYHNDESSNEIIQIINDNKDISVEKSDETSVSIESDNVSNNQESNLQINDKISKSIEQELEDKYDESLISRNLFDNELLMTEITNSDKKYEILVLDTESIEKTLSEPDSCNSNQTFSDDITISKDDLNKEQLIDNIIETLESDEKLEDTITEMHENVINEQNLNFDRNDSHSGEKITTNNESNQTGIEESNQNDNDLKNKLEIQTHTEIEERDFLDNNLSTNNTEEHNNSLSECEAYNSNKFVENENEDEREGKNDKLITEDNNKDVINRQQIECMDEMHSTLNNSNEDRNAKKNHFDTNKTKSKIKINGKISKQHNLNNIKQFNNRSNTEDINIRKNSISLPLVSGSLDQNEKLKIKNKIKSKENFSEKLKNKDKFRIDLEKGMAIKNPIINKEFVQKNKIKSKHIKENPKYSKENEKIKDNEKIKENGKIDALKTDKGYEIMNGNERKNKLQMNQKQTSILNTKTKINVSLKNVEENLIESKKEFKENKTEVMASPHSSVTSRNNNQINDSNSISKSHNNEKTIYSSEESIFDSTLIFEDLNSEELDAENQLYLKTQNLSPDNLNKNETESLNYSQSLRKTEPKLNIVNQDFSPPLHHKCNSKLRCSHRLHMKSLPPNVGKIETSHIGSRVDSRLDKLYLLDIHETKSDNERERKKIYRRQRTGSDGSIDQNTITQTVEKNLRKFYLERELFEELRELKRFQIRSGKSNETLLVKRLADKFRKEVKAPGMSHFQGPYNYKAYEMYLYDQIRRLSSSNHGKVAYITRSTSHENIASFAHLSPIDKNNIENEEKKEISDTNNDQLIKVTQEKNSEQLTKLNKKASIIKKLKNKEEVEKILSSIQLEQSKQQCYSDQPKSELADNARVGGELEQNDTMMPSLYESIEQISINGSSKSSVNTIISRTEFTRNTPISQISTNPLPINFQSNNRYKFRKKCLKPRTRVEPIESAMNRPKFKRMRMNIPNKQRIETPIRDIRKKWRNIKETEMRKLYILRKCKSIDEIKQESNFTLWFEINKPYKRLNKNKSLFSAKLKQIKDSIELNIPNERFQRTLSDSAINLYYFH